LSHSGNSAILQSISMVADYSSSKSMPLKCD
jgi:hypothetical protein